MKGQFKAFLLKKRQVTPKTLPYLVLWVENACSRHNVPFGGVLGHADISTTMIYTHVARKNALGVVSPFDRLSKTGQST